MGVFKYFKGHLGAVIAVICLMCIQVVADLNIPRCTSDIVNVGIQQYGIESGVSPVLTEETYRAIYQKFEDSQDQVIFGEFYELCEGESTPYYSRSAILPEAEQSDTMVRVKEMILAYEAQLYEQKYGLEASSAEDTGLRDARVASFIREEYEKLGMDVSQIQITYLLQRGGVMLGLTLLSLGLAVAIAAIASRTAAKIARDVRERVFESVLGFSRRNIQEFSTASLITRCTNDITQIQSVIVMLMRVVVLAPIMAIGAGIMVAMTAPNMFWIVGVAVAAILLVVISLLCLTMPRFKLMQQLIDRVNLVAREELTGVNVIRAFGRESHEQARFDKANEDLTANMLFVNHAMASMAPAIMLIMNGTGMAIIWFGAFEITAGIVRVGDLMAFMNYAMLFCMSFMMLTMIAIMLPRAQVSSERIEEVLATKSDIQDAENARTAPELGWQGSVQFTDVSLRFPAAEGDVLHDISFSAYPGQVTAIVGSTGSGKSTLLRMIGRIYDATQGTVYIDGHSIKEYAQSDLHKHIGYVPQTSVLFSGTIRSNIAYSDPNMPDEQVKHAAQVAQALEFIEQKPNGFDAEISQGGLNVSGGQRQRLAIARAVASQPVIYLLDDAMSALDGATDAAVRSALRKETQGATIFMVTQRIASALDADQILVLDEGKLVGCGTHSELMNSCETYREIAQSQLSAEELKSIEQTLRGGDAS